VRSQKRKCGVVKEKDLHAAFGEASHFWKRDERWRPRENMGNICKLKGCRKQENFHMDHGVQVQTRLASSRVRATSTPKKKGERRMREIDGLFATGGPPKNKRKRLAGTQPHHRRAGGSGEKAWGGKQQGEGKSWRKRVQKKRERGDGCVKRFFGETFKKKGKAGGQKKRKETPREKTVSEKRKDNHGGFGFLRLVGSPSTRSCL